MKGRILQIYRVSTFSETIFNGNQAGVCFVPQTLKDTYFKSIASELNVSETAFIIPSEGKENSHNFLIRCFTPLMEVGLCGHSLIAAAKVLIQEYDKDPDKLKLTTKLGLSKINIKGNSFELSYPAFSIEDFNLPRILLSALGISQYKAAFYAPDPAYLLIHISGSENVASLQPYFENLNRIEFQKKVRRVIITSSAAPPIDFAVRFFGPWSGVDEEYVSILPNTVLVPYWSSLLGKEVFKCYYASSKRGGVIDLSLKDGRVFCFANAVVNVHAEMCLNRIDYDI